MPSTTASPSSTKRFCRTDDPRIAIGPIVAAARDQAHLISVAVQPEAVTAGPLGTADWADRRRPRR
jgi:hypothetical protein